MGSNFVPNTALIESVAGLIRNQQSDRNYLSPLGYVMTFVRLPNVIYDLQDTELPEISLGETSQGTPFARIPLGGDHIEYGQFPMIFKIDVDMRNYNEILTWMQSLGAPKSTAGSNNVQIINTPNLQDVGFGRRSDGILTVLNSENIPNIQYYFRDLVPLTLSSVRFTTRDTDVKYITAEAVFEYSYFEPIDNQN